MKRSKKKTRGPKFGRGKGNIPIDKTNVKRIKSGKVFQKLPFLNVLGKLLSLFTVLPPLACPICGSFFNKHDHYTRHIISSYGIIACPTTYWKCSNKKCRFFGTDTIIGVTGSANYSDEFLQKQKGVRYAAKTSLWNTRKVGEIYTFDVMGEQGGRAPSTTTVWKYDQKEGKLAYVEMTDQDVTFNGTLHIDGYWVKAGWRKFVEAKLGRELTKKEWKLLRYQVIYVVATEDKVILDFEITDINPSSFELIPLLNRIKAHVGEEKIKKVVSDEEKAIINSVKLIFPKATHSFCVFHQLENLTKKYHDEYKDFENLPEGEKKLYELGQKLILSESVIESTAIRTEIIRLASEMQQTKKSKERMNYIENLYHKNRRLLEKGFSPETNNVMEQLFSLIDDFVYQARSFKTNPGLKNFFSNLFSLFNHRRFNTGYWKGVSPFERAKLRAG